MHTSKTNHHSIEVMNNKLFGFWIYLMGDCILFATLFATYVVLQNATAGGIGGRDIFELPFVFAETLILLLSSVTLGFGIIKMKQGSLNITRLWLMVTLLLGIGFIIMELYEFHRLLMEGNGPDQSAFLSAFFTLVATHGLHVSAGIIWLVVMLVQLSIKGLAGNIETRLSCLSLFWHFLDIVWVCVFTFVYLVGVM